MKLMIYLLILIPLGVIISVSAGPVASGIFELSAQSIDNTSTKESNLTEDPVTILVAFVHEAAAYAKKNGREVACREFSDRNGSFFHGDLYIYAYDFDGITLAHPLHPDLIGKNRSLETDLAGVNMYQKLSGAARNGSGFVTFHYINPVKNNSSEKKLGYVEKIDGSWWIGSGIYGENLTIPINVK